MEFYELHSFQQIFSCATHGDNSGAVEDPVMQYNWDRKVEIIPSKNSGEYYDILVTKSGRGYKNEEDDTSPIIKLTGKERYKLQADVNKYVLVH
jgi:hypothetical protein